MTKSKTAEAERAAGHARRHAGELDALYRISQMLALGVGQRSTLRAGLGGCTAAPVVSAAASSSRTELAIAGRGVSTSAAPIDDAAGGTLSTALHFGHFVRRPAALPGTFIFAPQC